MVGGHLREQRKKGQHEPFFLGGQGKDEFLFLAGDEFHALCSMVAWRLYFWSWWT